VSDTCFTERKYHREAIAATGFLNDAEKQNKTSTGG